jgi:acyl-CoA synthetase (AMP-forming)/AMP-acid ligase II
MTLPQFVLGHAHTRSDKRALIEPSTGRELTYPELAAAVNKVAAGLAAQGVEPGDVLTMCAPNSIELIVAIYAALSIGAAVATASPTLTCGEILYQLQGSDARWLVTTAELFEQKLAAAAWGAPVTRTFVIGTMAAPHPRAIPFWSLRANIDGGPPAVGLGAPGDVAFLPTSSGTAGPPKHVMLTHRNVVANLTQLRLVHRVREHDVVATVMPVVHILGFTVTAQALLEGATVVLLPWYQVETFLGAIEDHGVTRAVVVPPILLELANDERVDTYDVSTLRLLTSAAAPLPVDVARACAGRLGCRVNQAFGLTELSGGTHVAPEDGPDRPDSVGPPLPGVECRVVEPDTGEDVSRGQAGELLVRSASAMRGYLDVPTATDAAIDVDGWVHTGDIVTVDADGWYRVVDRIKELIKYGGKQIAPAELEAVLLTHPAIADAAVVRSPDPAAGEVPKAFVVLKAPASPNELIRWVADRVAPYKRVRRVEFVDEIPKSPSGKIVRRTLIERDRTARDEV